MVFPHPVDQAVQEQILLHAPGKRQLHDDLHTGIVDRLHHLLCMDIRVLRPEIGCLRRKVIGRSIAPEVRPDRILRDHDRLPVLIHHIMELELDLFKVIDRQKLQRRHSQLLPCRQLVDDAPVIASLSGRQTVLHRNAAQMQLVEHHILCRDLRSFFRPPVTVRAKPAVHLVILLGTAFIHPDLTPDHNRRVGVDFRLAATLQKIAELIPRIACDAHRIDPSQGILLWNRDSGGLFPGMAVIQQDKGCPVPLRLEGKFRCFTKDRNAKLGEVTAFHSFFHRQPAFLLLRTFG